MLSVGHVCLLEILRCKKTVACTDATNTEASIRGSDKFIPLGFLIYLAYLQPAILTETQGRLE